MPGAFSRSNAIARLAHSIPPFVLILRAIVTRALVPRQRSAALSSPAASAGGAAPPAPDQASPEPRRAAWPVAVDATAAVTACAPHKAKACAALAERMAMASVPEDDREPAGGSGGWAHDVIQVGFPGRNKLVNYMYLPVHGLGSPLRPRVPSQASCCVSREQARKGGSSHSLDDVSPILCCAVLCCQVVKVPEARMLLLALAATSTAEGVRAALAAMRDMLLGQQKARGPV